MKHKEINFNQKKWDKRQGELALTLSAMLWEQSEKGKVQNTVHGFLLNRNIYSATAISAVLRSQNFVDVSKDGFRLNMPKEITINGFAKYLIRQAVKRNEENNMKRLQRESKKPEPAEQSRQLELIPASNKAQEALDAIFEQVFKGKIIGEAENLEEFITSSKQTHSLWKEYVSRVLTNIKKSA